MSEFAQIFLSIFIVASLTLFISRRFRISKRYERQARSDRPLDSWNALDKGIDPTVNDEFKP